MRIVTAGLYRVTLHTASAPGLPYYDRISIMVNAVDADDARQEALRRTFREWQRPMVIDHIERMANTKGGG